MSGPDGTFSLTGLAGVCYQLVAKTRESFVAPPPLVVRGGTGGVDIVLRPAASCIISVRGPDGNPPARPAGVGVYGPAGEVVLSIRTGREGRVEITRLDPGLEYRLVVGPAALDADLVPVVIDPWSPDDTEVRLVRALSVTGTVSGSSGRPAGNTRIAWRQPESAWRYVWTGSDGSFQIGPLPGGIVVLKAIPAGARVDDPALPALTVHAGDTRVELFVPE